MATKSDVLDILKENSTDSFYIQYNGFFTNHIAHGVVALYRLGAARIQMERFVDWYKDRLENAESRGYKNQSNVSEEMILSAKDADDLLGKGAHFYELVNHYKAILARKYDGSIEKFIKEIYPRILGSLHVELLHPVIQIGYGIDIGSTQMVAEGFAYQHMCHFAPISTIPDKYDTNEPAKGSLSLEDIFDKIRNDDKITTMLTEASSGKEDPLGKLNKAHLELSLSNEQIRSKVLQYVEALAFPDWFPTAPTKGDVLTKAPTKDDVLIKAPTKDDVLKLIDWVIDAGILLYTCCEHKNDFYILHGITGAWALKQILQLMDDTELLLKCIKLHLAFLFGLYIAMGRPSVCLSVLDETTTDDKTLEDYRKEVITMTADEHIYKLVQVCCCMGESTTDKAKLRLYKMACDDVINVKGEWFRYDSAESHAK